MKWTVATTAVTWSTIWGPTYNNKLQAILRVKEKEMQSDFLVCRPKLDELILIS